MENEQTLNTPEESSLPAHTQEELFGTMPEDMYQDMEDAEADPEGANNTEVADGASKQAETKPDEVNEDEANADNNRFDKHPRFKELNSRLKEAEENNRKLITAFEQMQKAQQQAPDAQQQTPYKDWSQMSEDELLDWQAADPKGFLNNVGEFVKHHIQSGITQFKDQMTQETQKQTYESRLIDTFEAYAQKNPDFDEMWDAGDIKKFMDSNPGHNAISAHMAMTSDKRQQEAVQKAVDEALKEQQKALKSKRATAAVLPSGPTSVPPHADASDAKLRDPNKFGGSTQVLYQRLLERRKAMGL